MPLCFVNGTFLFQSNMFFHLSFFVIFSGPRPLLPATSKSSALLKTSSLSLIKIFPHHCTPLALARPSKVSFKSSKLVSSWFLPYSINFTPLIAVIIAFSVPIIAISFSPRHHVSLPYSIADLTQICLILSFLMKTFSHNPTLHIL